ncbi:MAG: transcription elongation factor GreA [Thiotrichaceae bacterium]
MTRAPVTAKGAEELKEELKHLKKVVRPRIVADIATAREHGDLKENAEYHAAREQHGFNEGRIQQIEGVLSTAQIIDVPGLSTNNAGRVVFGATVELEDVETEEKVIYQIVGDIEADIKKNRIAVTSPIARAMIGKEEGEITAVRAPDGIREYEIIEVEYK